MIKINNLYSKELLYLGENKARHLLNNVSFNVTENELLGIFSNNQSELIVLSEILGNIRSYYSGEIIRKNDSYVYLDTHTMLYDNMTVLEYLMFIYH